MTLNNIRVYVHDHLLPLSGIVATALVIVLAVNASAIRQQMSIWKLLPEPEPLTELYFTQPNSVPTSYVSGEDQNVDFTVHNIEYAPTTYDYQIVEVPAASGSQQILSGGVFRLHQNQYKSLSVPVSLTDMGSKVQVAVKLTNENESVSYWLNRSGQ